MNPRPTVLINFPSSTQSEGTLKPVANFDCNADCQRLRKAMKGLGTDEKAIIDVLARRSISQRLDIVRQFKTLYGLDLIKELDSEISGNFFKVCRSLCLEPEVFDAEELREALEGIGTDEDCLIEILCCRTNAQIAKIKEAYKNGSFGRHNSCDPMITWLPTKHYILLYHLTIYFVSKFLQYTIAIWKRIFKTTPLAISSG